MKSGILAYGAYVPFYRISGEEYKKAWGNFAAPGVTEKTVMGYDEDVITMGLEAMQQAIESSGLDVSDIKSLYFATTSSPYSEKSAASTLAVALTIKEDIRTSDFTASPKAGTSALLAAMDGAPGLGEKCSIIAASDAPLSAADSNLDHSSGAGAASLLIGTKQPIAVLEETYSVARETLGERFRRSGDPYTMDHELRMPFVNEGMGGAVKGLLTRLDKGPEDIDHVAYYQPDGRTTSRALTGLGFKKEQLSQGEIAPFLGNVGTASSILSLIKVLGHAKPGDRVMLASYGFGGDAVSLLVQEGIESYRQKTRDFENAIKDKAYITYVDYLKIRRFLSSYSD